MKIVIRIEEERYNQIKRCADEESEVKDNEN